MLNYLELLGREYIPGRLDCFSLLKDCLSQNFGLEIPNYARPDRFWEDERLDLYERFWRHGFKPVEDKPVEIGDILLMPIRTPMNSHAALLVDTNLILHHPPGRLSCVDPLRPSWLPRVMTVLRHPIISAAMTPVEVTQQFHEAVPDAPVLRNPDLQRTIEELMAAEAREVRDPELGPGTGEDQPVVAA